jgi:hypothetical protein
LIIIAEYNKYTHKIAAFNKLSSHLELVKAERAYYKQIIAEASKYVQSSFSINTPKSKDIFMHYSFDYTQLIHIPHDPLQPGSLFFLVPYNATQLP